MVPQSLEGLSNSPVPTSGWNERNYQLTKAVLSCSWLLFLVIAEHEFNWFDIDLDYQIGALPPKHEQRTSLILHFHIVTDIEQELLPYLRQ